MQRTIRCGADIHAIGKVLPTPRGSVRIIGKRVHHDYVDYVVEQAEVLMISPFPRPSRLARIRERLRGLIR